MTSNRVFSLATLNDDGGGQTLFADHETLDVALLNAVEQRVLRTLLGREEHVESGIIGAGLRTGSLETLRFFAQLAEFASEEAVKSDIRRSSISLLSNPLNFLEFRRTGKRYASFMHSPASLARREGLTIEGLVTALSAEYAQRRAPLTDDEANIIWETLYADEISKRAENGAGKTRAPYEEFAPLGRVLADHAYRRYAEESLIAPAARGDAGPGGAAPPVQLSKDERAIIAAWCDQLEQQGIRSGDADVAPNIYPYVKVERLTNKEDVLVVVVVSPLDPWFVDERVPKDCRLPGVLMGLYDVSGVTIACDSRALADLEDLLTARLAGFLFRVMATKRGRALEAAAGDAAKIARYWFSEGVTALLGDSQQSGLENELAMDFWTRFVEQLLCARIAGVRTVETYPFDRVYIFEGTPANAGGAGSDDGDENAGGTRAGRRLNVRVLEAAIESSAPETRFQYLTGLEKGGDQLEDLILTNKKINGRSDLEFSVDDTGDAIAFTGTIQVQQGKDRARVESDVSLDLKAASAHRVGQMAVLERAMNAMLGRLISEEATARIWGRAASDSERDIRGGFDQDGLLFEYRSGADMRSEAPSFYRFDQYYKRHFRTQLKKDGLTPLEDDGDAAGEDDGSKFVVISYEPSLVQQNARKGGAKGASPSKESSVTGGEQGELYVGRDQAITLVIVADNDLEKGIQELDAERGDLRVLVEMIIKQRMREAVFLQERVGTRVGLIFRFLENFVHQVKNEVRDPERGAQIQETFSGLVDALRFDHGSLRPLTSDRGLPEIAAKLWMSGAEGETEQEFSDLLTAHVAREARRIAQLENEDRDFDRDISVELTTFSAPMLSVKAPIATVRECLNVLLSNAVQAAAHPDAPDDAKISIRINAYPLRDESRWVFSIVIENTCESLDDQTLQRLVSKEPVQMEANRKKRRSSGIGVFTARSILRDGLGDHADISYQLISDTCVQARMTLPAHLEEGQVHPRSGARKSKRGPRLLYIEDNASIAAKSKAWLESLVGGEVTLANNLADAAGEIERGAALVISDIRIPDKASTNDAREKHGVQAIQLAMEQGARSKRRQPIWVVSSADRAFIEKSLSRLKPGEAYGYEIADAKAQLDRLAEDGVVTILQGVKELNEDTGLGAAIVAVLGAAADTDAQELAARDGGRGARPVDAAAAARDSVRVLSASLSSGVNAALARRAVEAHDEGAQPIAVVTTSSKIESAIKSWISHPGLPDPEVAFSDPDDAPLFPLWDAFNHLWVVLSLPASSSAKPLSLRARYWLLRHNVAVAAGKPEEVGVKWATMGSEASGPFASIRHDVRNIRHVTVPQSVFDDVESTTLALDAHLGLDEVTDAALADALVKADASAIATTLATLDTAADAEDVARDLIDKLERRLAHLARACEKDGDGNARATLARLAAKINAARHLLLISEGAS